MRRLLPAPVAVQELRRDVDVPLFPEEQVAVTGAVEKRRREFVTSRECVRRALLDLGLPVQAVARGEHGEPVWPAGVVGSVTHCHGYRAAAVARSVDIAAIGVDAEPHEPLPVGVLRTIALPEELDLLALLHEREPGVHWDRLLFCAKEAVFKVWFPAQRRWLGFEEATIVLRVDGTFTARLRPQLVIGATERQTLDGSWTMQGGVIMVAIALAAQLAAPGVLRPL